MVEQTLHVHLMRLEYNMTATHVDTILIPFPYYYVMIPKSTTMKSLASKEIEHFHLQGTVEVRVLIVIDYFHSFICYEVASLVNCVKKAGLHFLKLTYFM